MGPQSKLGAANSSFPLVDAVWILSRCRTLERAEGPPSMHDSMDQLFENFLSIHEHGSTALQTPETTGARKILWASAWREIP